MSDHVAPFPPRTAWDIAVYDQDECVAGYRDYRPDDPPPGANHSPAYRWGWTNRRRDITGASDGFEGLRYEFFQMTRSPH